MTRSKTIQAVLFDLDGTLIDSAPDLAAAADRMRTERGLEPKGLAAYRHMAGAGARGMVGVAFGIAPVQPEFEALKQEFLHNYSQMLLQQTLPFEGVPELIRCLDDLQLPWGIVTNKVERFTLPLVTHLKALSTASVVVGGDTTPHPKPHPAPLLEAARRLRVEPGRCVYVGDDERDIVAGRAAGMRTVAACYGYLGVQSDPAAWDAESTITHPLGLLNTLGLA